MPATHTHTSQHMLLPTAHCRYVKGGQHKVCLAGFEGHTLRTPHLEAVGMRDKV